MTILNSDNKNEIYEYLKSIYIKADAPSVQVSENNQKLIERYFSLLTTSLILNDRDGDSRFYAYFLSSVKRTIIHDQYFAPAAVYYDDNRMTFVLLLNPYKLFLFEQDEIVAVLMHELLHVANSHIYRHKVLSTRYNKLDMQKVNIAMDCAINQFIKNLPNGTITLKSVREMTGIKNIRSKANFEYYLELLLKSKKVNKNNKSNGQSSKNSEDPNELNDNDVDSDGNLTESGKEKRLSQSRNHAHDKWDEIESSKTVEKEMSEKLKDILQDIKNRNRGNLPNNMEGILQSLLGKQEIAWQKIFKNMIGGLKVPFKRTPMRRSRRQPDRPDVLGRISDRECKVAVALDMSGSMTNEELAWSLNEVIGLLKGKKSTVTIIHFDSEVGTVYDVRKKNDIKFKRDKQGGTEFSPVIKYVNKNLPKTDVLVVFTDGYGEYELEEKPNCQMLWIITRGNELSVRKPYGKIRYNNYKEEKDE
ncbi:zincin-like protease fused to vWA domain [Bacillus phage AR9]|uniref:Zincin-like protease fused to vWA domain n=1 Tax=Bacillus phage AR9 TaxID=1815509 RepID=A0A172JHT2_BPPB1|nr:HNH endonuclease [Bacillus phage AR9]AMS01114.1 zincin-like protease fused to vWA domain [Bacillus phage AR9]